MKAWTRFDLAGASAEALGKPTKVANDADVQGLPSWPGRASTVITLGTGFGTAVFLDGHLLPHLELAHQPFRKGETYNDQLGEPTRKEIGDHRGTAGSGRPSAHWTSCSSSTTSTSVAGTPAASCGTTSASCSIGRRWSTTPPAFWRDQALGGPPPRRVGPRRPLD